MQAALRHDAQVAFPPSLQDVCGTIAVRLACDDVWQRGALAAAFQLEHELAHGSTAVDGILRSLGKHADAFAQAVAILMPLKAFLRALVDMCNGWVCCNPAAMPQLRCLHHVQGSAHVNTCAACIARLYMYAGGEGVGAGCGEHAQGALLLRECQHSVKRTAGSARCP